MSKQMTRSVVDMTAGKPSLKIIQFAIPLLFSNLFQQLYNTVDSAIVGNYLGTKALAAVGAGFPVMVIVFSSFVGLGMASTIMVGTAVGARDRERVNLIISSVYRFSFYLIIPMTIASVFLTNPILRMLNVPDDGTLTMATQYLQVIFLGLFATIGYNTNMGFFQGLGDSVTSLKLLIFSTIVNISLDFLFVVIFSMGVMGAALATVVAQSLAWILGLIALNRHEYVRINLLRLDMDREILKEALRQGLPMAMQNALFSLGSMAMISLVNSFGHQFMAGFNSANKVDTFVFLPVQSLSNTMTTYTSQNVGARQLPRLRKGFKDGLVITLIACVALVAMTYPASAFLIRIFGDDPGMIESGLFYLHTVLPFYPLLALLFMFNAVLRGAGQAFMPMFTSLVSMIFIRVPSAYILASVKGKEFIFYSYGIGWFFGAILSGCFLAFGKWRPQLVAKLTEPQVDDDKAVLADKN
ncbi:MAG: MATE family efflux transporter [Eubacteriales bacterium]|nr:MATE family efflux transporter [Eubacteriales bacterium]